MVLLAYRHGLRPIELVTLRWDAIDFAHGQIHVSRWLAIGSPVERRRAPGAAPAPPSVNPRGKVKAQKKQPKHPQAHRPLTNQRCG
jgi:hypothetical protein